MSQDLFDRLSARRADNDDKIDNDYIHAQRRIRMMEALEAVLATNSTRPVNVSCLRVNGANNTRTRLIEKQITPILSRNMNIDGFLKELDASTNKLAKFGIFDSIFYKLDLANDSIKVPGQPADTLNLDTILFLRQAKKFKLRTGTDLGNGEGSAYVSLNYKNIFGGAEAINVESTFGTRTRSSYVANFTSPINDSPYHKLDIGAFVTSRISPYASHDQVLRGITAKVLSEPQKYLQSEYGYEAAWRTVTDVGSNASDTIRSGAGDSVKSSLFTCLTLDTRDDKLLPQNGTFLRCKQELAGYGPLGGSTSFAKTEAEGQVVSSSPKGDVTLSLGARGGILYGLGQFDSSKSKQPNTNILDRFYLGGPNSVRGFSLGGLGPKDGNDSIGGEIYLAGGTSIITRLPRLSRESPLRLQGFINGGSALPLDQGDIKSSWKQLTEFPSVAAGLGLIYRHPVARFELNFCLPLAIRQGDLPRKGIQFGIGMEFL